MSKYRPTLNNASSDAETLEWMSALRGHITPREISENPREALEVLAEEGLTNEVFRRMSERERRKAVGRVKQKLRANRAIEGKKIEAEIRDLSGQLDDIFAGSIFGTRPDGRAATLEEHMRRSAGFENEQRALDVVMSVTGNMMRSATVSPAFPGATDIMTNVTFDTDASSPYMRHASEDLTEVAHRFMERGLVLERPQGMSYHHFIDYLEEAHKEAHDAEFWRLISEQRSVVVEHDWHRAFEQGTGFTGGGEIRLPYDYTCFEFRVSGVRVLALTSTSSDTGTIWCWLVVGINRRWYLDPKSRVLEDGVLVLKRSSESLERATRGSAYHMSEVGERLAEFVARQMRACCIVLDAGIAIASPQSQSPKLNARRQAAGKSVLKPYHVVSLAPRYHERKDHQGGTHASPRFHWRRGHHKHYKEAGSGREQYVDRDGYTRSRTWVNWMPVNLDRLDLGFVDKHYKL